MDNNTITGGALAALGAGIIATGSWFFRMVLTNNKRVELLEQAIQMRATASEEAHRSMAAAVKDLTTEVKGLSVKLAKIEGGLHE